MKKEVLINGKTYPSIKALCQEYGIGTDYVYRRMKENGETLEEAIKNIDNKSFVVDGKRYTSIQKACSDLGISYPRVLRRINDHGDSKNEAIEHVRTHPQISLKEWCDKNDREVVPKEFVRDNTHPGRMIEDISYASSDIALWKCIKCNETWEARIKDRTIRYGDHGKCKFAFHISLQEAIIFFYIKQIFSDAESGFTSDELDKKVIDIYIPSLNLAIEYDGSKWHNLERDIKKSEFIKEQGKTLIRIRGYGSPDLPGVPTIKLESKKENRQIPNEKVNELIDMINQLFNLTNTVDIDIKRDIPLIRICYNELKYKKSLAATNAECLKEFDYESNDGLTPDMIPAHSHEPVFWRCSRCHELFSKSPHERLVQKELYCSTCNYQSENQRRTAEAIQKGEKKAVADDPYLFSEWDWDNNTLDPHLTALGSNEKANWICSKCGNSFSQIIKNRSGPQKQGCPKCGRRSQAKTRGHAVRNIDTGEEFESLSAASRRYTHGRFPSTNKIRDCCEGKTEQAYGYKWEYVSDKSKKK